MKLLRRILCPQRKETVLYVAYSSLALTLAVSTATQVAERYHRICVKRLRKYILAKNVREPLMRSLISLTANFTFREEKY
tara:strand:+ start:2371 stop:2610 length:240 start_codon:yes stop_codon:yes gene_type:complete